MKFIDMLDEGIRDSVTLYDGLIRNVNSGNLNVGETLVDLSVLLGRQLLITRILASTLYSHFDLGEIEPDSPLGKVLEDLKKLHKVQEKETGTRPLE